MACSFTYLLTRGNRTSLMGAMGFMIALYIGVRHGRDAGWFAIHPRG